VLRPGDTIDGFELGEVLHEGGMALLFRVTRPGEALPLLMKVPRLRPGEDPAAIVSFEMEQMILPRLAGPHVPRFVAAAGFETEPYIVMERIEGPPLSRRLRETPLPPEEVATLGAAVAEALDSLHRQHVVHLDVKPANILFRPDGTAVLVDYGLARHEQLPDLMAEEFRLPFGTAPYMAPEQLRGIRNDPRSDLFALGAVMYQLATGVLPFGEPQHLRAVRRRLWRDPVPPRRRNPAVPPWLQEIILRCLEVAPERRHPTAAQLAFDLRHADQVVLGPRAARERRDPWLTVLSRRLRPEPVAPPSRGIAGQVAAAPIVAVAIETGLGDAALAALLRNQAAKIMESRPDARLACLNVLRPMAAEEKGRHPHVQRLLELRHWARPLGLPDHRVSFHVLEAEDAAAAILDYARANRVDHIVLGARENALARRRLGSVAARIAAEAPCTVTVVRRRGAE
jgi:nucleotide-binding universal stress UspA family protein